MTRSVPQGWDASECSRYLLWVQRLNQAQLFSEFSQHPDRRGLIDAEIARRNAGGGPPPDMAGLN